MTIVESSPWSSSSSGRGGERPWFERGGGDRFIPLRSAMGMGNSRFLLTGSDKPEPSPYRRLLADALLGGEDSRVLSFRFHPHQPNTLPPPPPPPPSLPRRRRVPEQPLKILSAPGLLDDYRLNLLDWGNAGVLALALEDTVHLSDPSSSTSSELVTVPEAVGPVSALSWAPDGRRIALGLNSSEVQLWDHESGRSVRTLALPCLHAGSAVSSLSWLDDNVITTGGFDGAIIDHDLRLRTTAGATTYRRGHRAEITRLRWSGSGQQLASAGSDGLVYIWDRSMSGAGAASSRPHPRRTWIHRFDDHDEASPAMALTWCPFQRNVLAAGGGKGGRSIIFYDTQTGGRINTVEAGSQVCSLLWSADGRELLSSHDFENNNRLILWNYPSMAKTAELSGHTFPVVHMARSPDGCTVASAASGNDESMRFWSIFVPPKKAKKEEKWGSCAGRTFIRRSCNNT